MAFLRTIAAHKRAKRTLLFALLFFAAFSASSQSPLDPTISVSPFQSQLTASPQTASDRFVAAHGQRGFIAGYASTGLEAWVYPFQIFKNYRVFFRHPGATDSIDAQTFLKQIEYRPDSITRIYQSPDFTVHEKLFIHVDSFGGVIQFTVESKTPLLIEARLTPVMGLMWPADLGPRTALWDQPSSSLLLGDSDHGYPAIITSTQTTAHTWPLGFAQAPLLNDELTLSLAPNAVGNAAIAWYLGKPNPKATQQETIDHLSRDAKGLISNLRTYELVSSSRYKGELDKKLQIETPDPAVNQAIRWSEIALEQALACTRKIGCGLVAGYGPSRIERRPQYAWFFAGDGMVAADGDLAAGDFNSARLELEFILRYQDKKSGMIWHELTQSAPLIDWAGKYPYLFAHVDTTLQFLSFVNRYVQQSGDLDFLHQHWPAIQLAYHYASSLIDPKTGLPTIPSGKEGGNEQTRMTDDLGLSTSWIEASASFSHLAKIMGDTAVSNEAAAVSLRAREKIQSLYWSQSTSFWIGGHTINGSIFQEQHSGPSSALDLHLFTPNAEEKILNRIASPDFLTPWGIRSVAINSPGYSPTAYAQGSVWPVNTAAWAQTFWLAHRSTTAYSIWRSLIPLSTFDSTGHIHEVFQGDAPIPQAQSVPEQSWSSAAFLTSTIHGLLGIDLDALHNQLTFSPHFPADWPTLTLRHLTIGNHHLNLQLTRTTTTLTLKIDNPGPVLHLFYSPELPLGARNLTATLNQNPIDCQSENFAQSTLAHLTLDIPAGLTEILIQFTPPK